MIKLIKLIIFLFKNKIFNDEERKLTSYIHIYTNIYIIISRNYNKLNLYKDID